MKRLIGPGVAAVLLALAAGCGTEAVSEQAARLPATQRSETVSELTKKVSKVRLRPNQPLM